MYPLAAPQFQMRQQWRTARDTASSLDERLHTRLRIVTRRPSGATTQTVALGKRRRTVTRTGSSPVLEAGQGTVRRPKTDLTWKPVESMVTQSTAMIPISARHTAAQTQ